MRGGVGSFVGCRIVFLGPLKKLYYILRSYDAVVTSGKSMYKLRRTKVDVETHVIAQRYRRKDESAHASNRTTGERHSVQMKMDDRNFRLIQKYADDVAYLGRLESQTPMTPSV